MRLKDFVVTSRSRGWLIEGLIPKGHVILLGGLPGVGKSWVVDAIVVHVASGKPFLGLPMMRGSVILVDEDTPSDELGNRLQRLATGLCLSLQDLPIEVHSMERINLADEQTLRKLESEVLKANSVLVVLDCLSKMMGHAFNEDSAKDANIAGTVWNRLKATGATVLVTHHLNKREGNMATDFVKLSRGSGALVSNSDTAFGIELGRRTPTRFNVYPVERRRKLGIREPFGIELVEDEQLTWAQLKQVDVTKEVSELAKEIYLLFARDRNKDNLTVNNLKKILAGAASDPDIRSALHELEDRGIMAHSVLGHNLYVYSLSSKLRQAPHK